MARAGGRGSLGNATTALPALADRDAEALLAEFSSAHAASPELCRGASPELCRGDEAFGEVVRRYASMVFAVCLRMCGNAHDAEDATQATFLTLAVQCKSGKPVQRLGPWLRQVATRAALDVRRARKRRETHEQRHAGQRTHEVESSHREHGRNGTPAQPASAGAASSDLDLEKLTRVLGEEIARLPPRYRLPLVCIYYSGMSRPDVAKELGCTLGTLGVRVHRGRQMLARRLRDRGFTPPGGVLSAGLLATAAQSVGHEALVGHVASAAGHAALGHDLAAAVAQGVLAALKATGAATLFAKLKGVAVVVMIAGLGAAAAGAATRELGAIAPAMPGAVRTVVEWVRGIRAWSVPVPRWRGNTPATPIAASHVSPAQDRAKPQAAEFHDAEAWTAVLQKPLSGTPVRFSDERHVPRATTTSLLDLAGAAASGPAVVPAIFEPDQRPWSRAQPMLLHANVRADLLRTGGPAAALAPAATPEPSGFGVCLVSAGWLLLRRWRRARPDPTSPTPA